MTITKTRLLSIALLFFLTAFLSKAQERLNLKSEGQELKIEGTSTLHDWHMTSGEANGYIMMEMGEDSQPVFTSAKISLEAESLKSGKRGMDKNAYKALNTSDFPNIQFVLDNCTMASATEGTATGKLTVAGTTRDVTLDIKVEQSGSEVTVQGSTAFRLTDFNVDPPTALLGTVKTGDDVTIQFNSTFQN